MIGALALRRGDVDALICGLEGRFELPTETHHATSSGLAPGAQGFRGDVAGDRHVTGAYFLADTHVNYDPTAEEIADMAVVLRPSRAKIRRHAEESR